MKKKKLIAAFSLENGLTAEGTSAVELSINCDNNGADELFITDLSTDDHTHEQNIGVLKEISRTVDIPVIAGGNVKRFEDIKKYLYTGAKCVYLDSDHPDLMKLIKEGSERFGTEKIAVRLLTEQAFEQLEEYRIQGAGRMILGFIPSHELLHKYKDDTFTLMSRLEQPMLSHVMKQPVISGMIFPAGEVSGFMEIKASLKADGIAVNTFESAVSWSDFKLNSDGLVPTVVQDYKTGEVLMMAYMNEESFRLTLKTGKMTYFSRSRQSLWLKGETSGHFQYVKALYLDCDNDTLLAKVSQVGAACHTGSRSCFFQELAKKDYDDTNPLTVFEDVYQVIMDRKRNPKEGSYTNYLFDKGIDKILKKVGEEATEIVIAAKNPDAEEIKYEISDFLYHVMVLMAEKGVSWEDITKELANR